MMEVNIPEVVEEVRALFERYERALIDKDVEVLDDTFWNSPHTIRYAIHENGYGFDEIHARRARRPPGPGIEVGRRHLVVTTLGRDIAAVTCAAVTCRPGRARPGCVFRMWAGR